MSKKFFAHFVERGGGLGSRAASAMEEKRESHYVDLIGNEIMVKQRLGTANGRFHRITLNTHQPTYGRGGSFFPSFPF